MKTKIFLISLLIFNSILLKAQLENSTTHRNLFLSTCCGEFSLADAAKSSITDTVFCERWNFQTGMFSPYNMTVNSYDVKGRMVESTSGYFILNGTFRNISRYEFTYFPFDSLLSETHYYWSDTMNGTGGWDNSQLIEYTYDLTLKLIQTDKWYSPIGTTAWQNNTREYFTYGSNGLVDIMTTEYWNTNVNGWWNYLRYRYIYDINDNLLEQYYDYSNNSSGTWTNSSRFVFSYAKDRMDETQQVYTSKDWRNSKRSTHTLNSMGLSEEILKEMWNIQDNMWDTMFMEKDLFYYNSSGQLTEHIYMSSYIQWFNVSRETYTYDLSGTLIQKNEYDWNHNDVKWDHRTRCTYTSTATTLSINSEEEVEFDIYPNPTSDYLNIIPGDEVSDGLNIYLINASGQTLKAIQSGKNDAVRIDVKEYPVGVYFVQIEIDGKSTVVRKVFFQ